MTSLRLYALGASLLIAGLPVSALAQQTIEHADKHPVPAVIEYARELARLGGAARYCKLDSEMIEEYMDKASAQIHMTAKDQYEKVVAHITFKDALLVESSTKPTKDCSTIEAMLKQALRSPGL